MLSKGVTVELVQNIFFDEINKINHIKLQFLNHMDLKSGPSISKCKQMYYNIYMGS